MTETRGWSPTVVAVVVAISVLHCMTNARLQVDQVIYAKLYYLPVLIVALDWTT